MLLFDRRNPAPADHLSVATGSAGIPGTPASRGGTPAVPSGGIRCARRSAGQPGSRRRRAASQRWRRLSATTTGPRRPRLPRRPCRATRGRPTSLRAGAPPRSEPATAATTPTAAVPSRNHGPRASRARQNSIGSARSRSKVDPKASGSAASACSLASRKAFSSLSITRRTNTKTMEPMMSGRSVQVPPIFPCRGSKFARSRRTWFQGSIR